jgi:hypothetical protein
MHIYQTGNNTHMQTIQKFRAEGQTIAIEFLKSFITKISVDDEEKSNYAKITAQSETVMVFDCTPEVYDKLIKKMTKISVTILPI